MGNEKASNGGDDSDELMIVSEKEETVQTLCVSSDRSPGLQRYH